jgi:hypothetical protein
LEFTVSKNGMVCKILIFNLIMALIVYGCETWPLTMREECRVRVSENRVLRWISRLTRDEVTGEWRRLHNEKLYALYSSTNIIRVIKSRRLRWTGHVARMSERRGAYRALIGKPKGSGPPGRPRRRRRIILKWIFVWLGGGIDWIDLAQGRDRWRALVNTVMNLRVP